jgi:predicted DsbA family dithiol-disulfide isomerase
MFSLNRVISFSAEVERADMVASRVTSNTHPRFYFDFVDPLSYVQEIELTSLVVTTPIEPIGFELAPPPAPLTSIDHERWQRRYAEARVLPAAAGLRLDPPPLVPWTRKAHELHLLAREAGRGDEARRAIFRAYFDRGEDIGRVDRLVEVAASLGFDRTTVKAALDVDRYDDEVVRARRSAVEAGIVDTPSVASDAGILRGFHNREALGSLLRGV